MRFFYDIVAPLESALATQDPTAVWRERIGPNFGAYMGHIFATATPRGVLKAAQLRFRELPPGLHERVHAVEDLEILDQLLQTAITGESVEAFQREVEVALGEGRSPASPE